MSIIETTLKTFKISTMKTFFKVTKVKILDKIKYFERNNIFLFVKCSEISDL